MGRAELIRKSNSRRRTIMEIMNNSAKRVDLTDLQFLTKSGMIQNDEVLALVMKAKVTQVKSVHRYAITPPKREGERWQTSFKKVDGTRINIRGNSEEDLLLKLYPLYFNGTHIDKMTFRNVFDEWIEYKSGLSSPNTVKRHRQHYAKYVAPSKLDRMELRKIDDLCIEVECNRIVREFNLSNKEWVNLKTVINGCFEYAVKKKYVSSNPMSNDEVEFFVRRESMDMNANILTFFPRIVLRYLTFEVSRHTFAHLDEYSLNDSINSPAAIYCASFSDSHVDSP